MRATGGDRLRFLTRDGMHEIRAAILEPCLMQII
jgi:hypothetical protein